jgi:3',5'-cyclic AMP phosphodiesterase CpdA
MPDPSPDAFTVRIVGPNGESAGVGVLVGERHIVTCAHVVNAALGRYAQVQDQPTDVVTVEFPLVDVVLAAGHPPRGQAAVVKWLPPPREGAAGDDLAGLVFDEPAPTGATPALLAINVPPAGRAVRVFGYQGIPPGSDGDWVATTIRDRADGGLLQLDSGPDSALRVQPGFSGSPVFDDSTGRITGLVASTATGRTPDRYAVDADRLRLAWPEILGLRSRRARHSSSTGGRPGRGAGELTILHVSDPQFGAHHLFGGNGLTPADQAQDTLFRRLHDDLAQLEDEQGLLPDLLVVTGDLAERGLRSEFKQVTEFLSALSEAAQIPRRHVAIVPGNHDINRKACEAYFADQESDEAEPVPPYWPKWRKFSAAFADFYADVDGVTFTPDEPWTLFEMPELSVVVAGMNSTIAESHRDADHYGWVGEHQLRWFADRLGGYRARGWLRLAAVHHNVVRGAAADDENLRDADDLDRLIGQPALANLVLHGHTHDGRLHRLPSGLAVLSTGSAAVDTAARPAEVPNQYQLITVRRDGFTRHARQYALGQRRWIGDTRISPSGSDWRVQQKHELTNIDKVFSARPSRRRSRAGHRSAA